MFVVCLWCSICAYIFTHVYLDSFARVYFAKKIQKRKLLFLLIACNVQNIMTFWLIVLCKIIWNVQDILVKKGYTWDTMFQHVFNIWPLTAGHGCCCFEQNFWLCFSHIWCYLLAMHLFRFVWQIASDKIYFIGVLNLNIDQNKSYLFGGFWIKTNHNIILYKSWRHQVLCPLEKNIEFSLLFKESQT